MKIFKNLLRIIVFIIYPNYLFSETITKEDLNTLQITLHNFVYDVLGLTKEEQGGDDYLENALQLLIELRNDARKRKDFATSDKIRDELSKAGIVLQDGPKETTFILK